VDKKKSQGWAVLERTKSKADKNRQDKQIPQKDHHASSPYNHSPFETIHISETQRLNAKVMSSFIRKQTIKRHPLYFQEFEAAFQSFKNGLPKDMAAEPYSDLIDSFRRSQQSKELCQRWSLNFALHPNDEMWDDIWNGQFFFKDLGYAVQPIFSKQGRGVNALTDGRYLQIEIDLSASQGQIETEVAAWVHMYQKNIVDTQVKQRFKKLIVRRLLNENPQPPEDQIDQKLEEIFDQEEHQLPEIQKQVEKDKAFKRRRQSLYIYLEKEPPSGPVTIFQLWDMNKYGKSAWRIVTSLFPNIKGDSPENIEGTKEDEKNARAILRSVERAIKKVNKLITSLNLPR
jgi:hypothetical protein